MEAPPAASNDVASGGPRITDDMRKALLADPRPISPHVAVYGLKRTDVHALSRILAPLHAASTTAQLYDAAIVACETLETTAVIERAAFTFEPKTHSTNDAGGDSKQQQQAEDRDVVVRLDLTERKGRADLSATTTFTGQPEITGALRNVGGQGYAIEAHFLPSASGATGKFAVVSSFPVVGHRTEFDLGVRRQNRAMRLADQLTEQFARFTIDFGGSPRRSAWFHSAKMGYARRRVASTFGDDDIAPDIFRLAGLARPGRISTSPSSGSGSTTTTPLGGPFQSRSEGVFADWEAVNSALRFHVRANLASLYPLPVGGHFFRFAVGTTIVDPLKGVAAQLRGDSGSTVRLEAIFAKYYALLPIAVLGLSARCNAVVPLSADGQVPAVDRLFLGSTYVRGHRDIGPSTVSASEALALPTPPERYLSLGGDATWAVSATLSMPFLLYPNGLVGLHFFADAGQCANVGWRKRNLAARARREFSRISGSLGAGLVLFQVPLLGALPSMGRLEFNVALPWSVNVADKGFTVNEASPLFDRWRFGMHWTLADE